VLLTGHASLGTVVELHRYPVKSLIGERLDAAVVDRRGVVGTAGGR
jgi:uncharacterized protein YcbX